MQVYTVWVYFAHSHVKFTIQTDSLESAVNQATKAHPGMGGWVSIRAGADLVRYRLDQIVFVKAQEE